MSPDGRFFAFTTHLLGQPREVFISRCPEGSRRWPVSLAGGHTPRWARESGELFYIAEPLPGRHQFTVASVTTHPTLTVGTPSPLFHLAASGLDVDAGFDVTPDGKRILAVRTTSPASETGRLTIVQNWWAEFSKGKR